MPGRGYFSDFVRKENQNNNNNNRSPKWGQFMYTNNIKHTVLGGGDILPHVRTENAANMASTICLHRWDLRALMSFLAFFFLKWHTLEF